MIKMRKIEYGWYAEIYPVDQYGQRLNKEMPFWQDGPYDTMAEADKVLFDHPYVVGYNPQLMRIEVRKPYHNARSVYREYILEETIVEE